MEKYIQNNDVKIFYVTATSFPEGIGAAQDKIKSLLPEMPQRTLFGISYPEGGVIVYKAGVEETYDGEALKFGLPVFLLRKGVYNAILVRNYMQKKPDIGRAFQQLLAQPVIDPEGCCVEKYLSESEMLCMVRLDPMHQERLYLLDALKNAFAELQHLMSSLTDEQLNKIPFAGSWTAAQTADHLSMSYEVYSALNGKTRIQENHHLESNIKQLRDLFLNFEIKLKSPDFIIPSSEWINKNVLLDALKFKTNKILEVVKTKDLEKTCLEFEFPGSGLMTRLELLHFILYHTQRHIHQIKNISEHILG